MSKSPTEKQRQPPAALPSNLSRTFVLLLISILASYGAIIIQMESIVTLMVICVLWVTLPGIGMTKHPALTLKLIFKSSVTYIFPEEDDKKVGLWMYPKAAQVFHFYMGMLHSAN